MAATNSPGDHLWQSQLVPDHLWLPYLVPRTVGGLDQFSRDIAASTSFGRHQQAWVSSILRNRVILKLYCVEHYQLSEAQLYQSG